MIDRIWLLITTNIMIMTYAAGTFELLGKIVVGRKSKWGWLLNIICCLLWIFAAIVNPFIRAVLIPVIPSLFINIYNFRKWWIEEEK